MRRVDGSIVAYVSLIAIQMHKRGAARRASRRGHPIQYNSARQRLLMSSGQFMSGNGKNMCKVLKYVYEKVCSI